jgi:hypothetical protein
VESFGSFFEQPSRVSGCIVGVNNFLCVRVLSSSGPGGRSPRDVSRSRAVRDLPVPKRAGSHSVQPTLDQLAVREVTRPKMRPGVAVLYLVVNIQGFIHVGRIAEHSLAPAFTASSAGARDALAGTGSTGWHSPARH